MAEEVAVSRLSVSVPHTWALVLELEKRVENSSCVREEYECFSEAADNGGPALAEVCVAHSHVG
jgi:hypothetical protein